MAVNRPDLYASTIIVSVFSLVAVVGRFGLRWARKTKLGADDWTALAGLVAALGITGMTLAGTSYGYFGTHTAMDPSTHAVLPSPHDYKSVQYQLVILVLLIPTIGLIKLSVIFLYRRIFEVSRNFQIYTIALIVLVCLWVVAFMFAQGFQCGAHLAAAWGSPKEAIKYCRMKASPAVGFSISDLIMDVMILLAPIPMVWKLVTTTTRKLQILFVFALGFLSLAACAVRLHYTAKAVFGTKRGFRDVREQSSIVVMWSVVEVNAALIACCLPALRPLFSDQGLSSVVNSIRSALSLHSLQSRHSDRRSGEIEAPLAPPEAAVLPSADKRESQETK